MTSKQKLQIQESSTNTPHKRNVTVCNILEGFAKEVTAEIENDCIPDFKNPDPKENSQTREQYRTTSAKKLILRIFAINNCNVSKVCEKTGIDRVTFYRWLEKDKQFAEGIREAQLRIDDLVEEKLLIKIFRYNDGHSIRYYLDRKHPDYMKPTRRMFSRKRIVQNRTLEDLLNKSKPIA